MELRYYQSDLKRDIYQAWADGARNVIGVLATGGGKTVTFCSILAEEPGASIVMAHRHELVGQISLALARNGVRHRIIGQPHLLRWCQRQSVEETKRQYVDQSARCAAASANTLVKMSEPWFKQVKLWVTDECHHHQKDNLWGRATALFPNARGLGMSATPERADGRGLGRPDGVFDAMVVGPPMRELINAGSLVDFQVFAPPSDIDTSLLTLSAGGDFNPESNRRAVHESKKIVGDVVAHYLKFAPGKLGVTFSVDIESATEIAAAFRAAGVPAEVVTGKTDPTLRSHLMGKFARGEFKQLCVVDIVSEGTDIPAIDVVSLARPSASYVVVAQQIGRALRPKEGKSHAIVIDHVGNVRRFARVGWCPVTMKHTIELDRASWTLDRRERRSRSTSDAMPVRTCVFCLADYPAVCGRTCPYCSETSVIADRSSPEMVDGDLCELSPDVLARMNGEILRIDAAPRYPGNATPLVRASIAKRHEERKEAQVSLRKAMAHWGGARRLEGLDDRAAQRVFMYQFGVDVGTAQTLGRPEAQALEKRVLEELMR